MIESDTMKGSVETASDPFETFGEWLGEAEASEPSDANAMALATAGADGVPDVRMVLLKSFDKSGFVFFTSRESIKGLELATNPNAALCFHWKSLSRQVRVRGAVEEVPVTEADAYFASRSKGSQIGAWASQQSQPIESRFALERAVAKYAAKFRLRTIPRPPYWVGFRINPFSIEFWQAQRFRLHDRIAFTVGPSGKWQRERLYP
jgi:pyridoxamine 5'-phosphate oxidase